MYEAAVKKYDNRTELLNLTIPPLDCTWKDVIFMLAVHPKKIAVPLALRGWGRLLTQGKFYKIPVDALDKEKLAVYLFETRGWITSKPREFISFNESDFSKYDIIRPNFYEYLDFMKKENKIPLSFVSVPHILYKSSIDVSHMELITLTE